MKARFDEFVGIELGDIVVWGDERDHYMLVQQDINDEIYLLDLNNGRLLSYGYYHLESFVKNLGLKLVCKNERLVMTNIKTS